MDWVQLTGYLISPLMAAAGWIVGTRLRRVNAVTHMQEAVDRLTEKNKEYINELVVIRRELAEVSELQTENRQLMARLNEQLNKGRGDGYGEH